MTKRSPADDFAPFVRRQPAVLTEVLAVGVEPHLLAGVELEPCIRTVVQARRRRRCYRSRAPRRMSVVASQDPLRGRGGGRSWVRIAHRDLLRCMSRAGRRRLFDPPVNKAGVRVNVYALITVWPGRELVRSVSGDHDNLPGMPCSCSDPTVNVAQPRRMTKVSAYACWCSVGRRPPLAVDFQDDRDTLAGSS